LERLRPTDLVFRTFLLLIAGLAQIAGGELWNIWTPIDKKLWTSSYVLHAATLAHLRHNVIAAYVLSEVLAVFI
jgi:predicted acyltransferase